MPNRLGLRQTRRPFSCDLRIDLSAGHGLNWRWMAKCADCSLARLQTAQNTDGGWGYFPGKQSWLEPTAYALLALLGEPGGGEAFERGWRLLRRWQLPSGGWQACAGVHEPHWATSLAVLVHCVTGVYDEAFRAGVAWLLASTGSESRAFARVAHWLRPSAVEFNPKLLGWPWQAGTSSWIEPTAHALMALGRVVGRVDLAGLEGRIDVGKRMLLDRQSSDGGWNYGNRRVLGADLPSYPETTALALMALDGHPAVAWATALERVERLWHETRSPLARAWLGACLLQYRGVRPETTESSAGEGNDLLVTAVEAIRWNEIMTA